MLGESLGVSERQRSDIEGEADGAVVGSHHLTANQAGGGGYVLAVAGPQRQDAAVEQHRLVEILPVLGEVQMVDPGQEKLLGRRRPTLELADPRRLVRGDPGQEDLRAVGGAEGGQVLLVGTGAAKDGRCVEVSGAIR
jgi:hypothetical protein